VLTGADVRAEGHKPIPHKPQLGSEPDILLQQRDGGPAWISPHYALPWDKARFVGEPVAMVLAESRQLARDAAELVEIEWEPLPAVTDPRGATAADAPQPPPGPEAALATFAPPIPDKDGQAVPDRGAPLVPPPPPRPPLAPAGGAEPLPLTPARPVTTAGFAATPPPSAARHHRQPRAIRSTRR
jgi:CO/xanthine dehydrogenase Mo-binding subunit